MVAALIETIRHGQGSLVNQRLADLGVRRELITPTQSSAALAAAAPGELDRYLVEAGYVSQAQLEKLADELELVEMMETATDQSGAPPEVLLASNAPGRRVGRYVLVEEIGAGGMGVVWKGWDAQLMRWVAVKRLKVKDSKLVSRFMREASLLAQLSHPNITTVFEIGVHEGQPFLVMELVSGKPPEASTLSRRDAAAVVRDAARAVQYAHDRKIIHRDLKPSNLLVDADGRVFVTDFGLARMREEAASLTVSGALLGTPAFMAPEQAQGREADHRSDVYGLGATLYALVEGKPPHTGEIVHELVRRVAVANPPTLSGSDDLVVIVQKTLERDREDRYASARELADELDRFINDEPIEARKVGTIERSWRRAKRRPAMAGSIAAGLAVVLAMGTWGAVTLEAYYSRQSQIAEARPFVSSAETIADQIRDLYSREDVDLEWEAAGLRNLEREADAALAAAPGYAPAEYFKGLVHLWRDEYAPAVARFDAALADDSAHYAARVYHLVALNAADDAASPEIIQDGEGFRIVPAPDTAAKAEVIAAMQADLAVLPPEHPLERLARATLQSARGDFDAAYRNLEAHLGEHPYDQKMRGLLLWTLLAVGRYAEVVDVAGQMITRDAFPATAESAAAFAHAGLGDLDAAVAAMERSIALRPDIDDEHWIAFWSFKQGYVEEAFTRYQRILERSPNHVESLLGRAAALTWLAEDEGALDLLHAARRDVERALEQRPEHAYAHFALGQATSRIDPAVATAAFERAISLDRDYFEAHANAMIATTHALAGNLAAAIPALEAAIELEPANATWVNMLARFHLLNDDPTKAIEIVAARDNDADSLGVLASALTLGGDYAGALAAARRAAELEPDDPAVLANLGYYAGMAEDEAAIEDAFERAHALAPGDVGLYSNEATAWLIAGRPDLALEPAERLAERPEVTPYDHRIRAQVYAALERVDDAIEAAALAVTAEPDVLDHQLEAARLLVAAGRGAEAEQQLPLLESEPADYAARVELQLVLGRCDAARAALAAGVPSDPAMAGPAQSVAASCRE